MFKNLLDSRRSDSLGNKFRRKRFGIFLDMIKDIPRPVRIIDLGGVENFWIQMGLAGNKDYNIIIVNPEVTDVVSANLTCLKGDACSFSKLNTQYDVIFSNSVIEHVGSHKRIKLMADEILNSGKPYFVQTPNYYFPFEPHFLFPFFQFLPEKLKIFMVMQYRMGWYNKCRTYEEAKDLVTSVNLLKRSELFDLFPGCELEKEKFFLFTKSNIVLKKQK